MAGIALLLEHMRVLSILFKHWFFALISLLTGGPPLKDLSSEIVLITGAASGLGKGMAERLARLGCTLVLWDVDEANNQRLAEELSQTTSAKRVVAMTCDLTKREHIYECAKKVQNTVGNVTMIINNAGVVTGKTLLNCSDAAIERTFDVNVLAHFWIIKAFLPWMLENNRGHIVNIASGAGLVGVAGLIDYCSSKFAAVGLHHALTHELYSMKKTGIRTTVVCPSFTNTGMFSGATANKLSPMLNPEVVCDAIIDGIRKNEYMVVIPKSMVISLALNAVTPTAADLEIQSAIGLHRSMDHFVGRQGNVH